MNLPSIPAPPAGFTYDAPSGEWEGMDARHPDDAYGGAWSDWTPEQGTTITLDVGKMTMSLEDARAFARMLSEFVERHDTPVK